MARTLSNILGLGRHAECKNCDDPIAEEGGNKSGRWRGAPPHPVGKAPQKNADGSSNLDATACNTSKTGKHQPRDGSMW